MAGRPREFDRDANTREARECSMSPISILCGVATRLFGCFALVPFVFAHSSGYAAEPLKVRLAQIYQIHGAQMFDPFFVEKAEKYGISVEVVPMKRYGDVQLALATGGVEFGVLGFFNIGTMADNNIENIKIIAGSSIGGQGLVCRKQINAKITNWKDLETLKVGVAPNGSAHNIFRTLIVQNGADLRKVIQVDFPGMGPEAVQSLRTGDIDCLLSWEPTDARAVVDGIAEYSSLKLEESPTGNINGAFAVNTDFASKHPEATLNMVRASVEATTQLNGDHDLWIRLASAKTGVSAAVVKMAIEHLTITYDIPEAKTKAFMDLMAKFGATKKNYRDVVPRYIDYSYLEKATGKTVKQLGAD
jgi:ABC-type nitrate/sulfonate/bicarbonate transport system substrate-binding protein